MFIHTHVEGNLLALSNYGLGFVLARNIIIESRRVFWNESFHPSTRECGYVLSWTKKEKIEFMTKESLILLCNCVHIHICMYTYNKSGWMDK